MRYRIPMVMDSSKLNYFARAEAVRFGVMSTAGALQGLGVVQLQLAKNGSCPAGFHAGPPGGTGNRYCLPDAAETMVMPEMDIYGKAPQQEEQGIFAKITDAITGSGEPKYKATVGTGTSQLVEGRTRTQAEVDRYLATGSFAAGSSPGEIFGLPKWLVVGGGLALFGVVAVVVMKK